MSKKTLILLVILLLIASGLLYAKNRRPSSITIAPENQSMTETISEAQKFAAAIASGDPYSCEITSEDTTMTYQIKGGKMYMTTVTPEYKGFMVNDTEYIYTWSDATTQGSKMKIPTEDEVREATESLPKDNNPSFSSESDYQSLQDQGYTIKCVQQSLDDSLFTPPSSINFIDPTEMMKDLVPN